MAEFMTQYPHFRNQHTATQALGLALLNTQVYYLSTAGSGTACKGIWGSLVGNRSQLDCVPWSYTIRGVKGIKTIYQSLPNSNFKHMVGIYREANLLIAVNPAASTLNDELDLDMQEQRESLLAQQLPDVQTRFLSYLNAYTDVPVLDEWAERLWQEALFTHGVTALTTYGDCLGAWLIREDFDWLEMVKSLLLRDEIAIRKRE